MHLSAMIGATSAVQVGGLTAAASCAADDGTDEAVMGALMEDREQLNTLMGLWGEEIEWETEPGLPDAPDNKDLPEHNLQFPVFDLV